MSLALQLANHPLSSFTPRPDQPELLDQQSSFYNDKFDGLACCLSGNGAGKSFCASAKVATFLLNTPPPEKNTPFWILSTTMDLVSANCWGQNLARWIPENQIEAIVWFSAAKSMPRTVVLKAHPNGNNWIIDLKSYDQDRQRLQAANIGGAWFDEQVPYDILIEVWARLRKYKLCGNFFYTLTPIAPDMKLEAIAREPPPSWRFYRMNTRCNLTLNPDYVKQISDNELIELVETRLTGAFARYEGAVYSNFSMSQHVIPPFDLPRQWLRIRGLDLGWAHCTSAVWLAKNLEGQYFVYREYNKSQTSVEDHLKEIQSGWAETLVKGETYADPAAAQVLHEFAIRGLRTKPAQKEVLAGIASVQTLLRPDEQGKPRLFIFNTCKTLIEQMRSYVYDPKTGKPKKETPDYHLDLCDSLRYAVFSYLQDSSVKVEQPAASKPLPPSFVPPKAPTKKILHF